MGRIYKGRKYTHEELITILRQNVRAGIDGDGNVLMYLRWWDKDGFVPEGAKPSQEDEYTYTARDVDEAFDVFNNEELAKITGICFKYPRLQKLPEAVRRLCNLQILNLYNTGIVRLPNWLPELANLKVFSIGDVWNKRGAKIADGLQPLLRMPQLKDLYWGDDYIGYLDVPDIIGELTRLERIIFSGTTMRRFPKWLCNLSSLRKFSYGGFDINTIPAWFCNLSSLEYFWLNDSRIRKLPDNFGNLTALKELYLFSNPISELPESFCSLVNLEKLVITGYSEDYDRDLAKLPGNMGNLKALRDLRINSNNVTRLPASLAKCVALQSLDISGAKLKTIPAWLKELSRLERLNISWTSITELPEWLAKLTNLKEIKISGKKISAKKFIKTPNFLLDWKQESSSDGIETVFKRKITPGTAW